MSIDFEELKMHRKAGSAAGLNLQPPSVQVFRLCDLFTCPFDKFTEGERQDTWYSQ